MTDETTELFDEWAVVELFGHRQIAGKVTEQQLGGATMLRIDVPETNGQAAFTRFYGGAAIYSITPCLEEVALAALRQIRPAPITTYVPELRALPVSDDPDDYF